MRLAIAKAKEGVERGQSPFGACIVRDGEVLACNHNEVWARYDSTAHAEIQALRTACASLQDVNLKGSVIYCTCEPCPMCFGAIHWARIGKIVFGAGIADSEEFGFNELNLSNQVLKRESGIAIQIEAGLLREECRDLFRVWNARGDCRPY